MTSNIINVTYNPRNDFLDTGLDLISGLSTINITASGLINIGLVGYPSHGPDGITQLPSGELGHPAALIGKTGINGSYFLIGSSYNRSPVNQSGRLYVGISDSPRSDNSGLFSISIEHTTHTTREYIIVFIDESTSYSSNSAQWIADVNSFNSTNFDANRIILFRVREFGCSIGSIYPTNANPAMPIPLSNIIDTPRASPRCDISGESLTGQWLYNRLLLIINNISSYDTIKMFVDNSGSMTRSSIEPAVTQFAELLTSSGATVYDQSLCSTERYFVWIVNAINNSFECAEPPSVTPTKTVTPTRTPTNTVTPTRTPTKTPKPTSLSVACRNSCCYYLCVENYDEYNNCIVNNISINFEGNIIQNFNNNEYQLLIEGNCVDPFNNTLDIKGFKDDCYGCSIVTSTHNNNCNDNNLFNIVASDNDYKFPTIINHISNANSNNFTCDAHSIKANIPDNNIRCCLIASRTPMATPTNTPTNSPTPTTPTNTPTNTTSPTLTPTNTLTPSITPTTTSAALYYIIHDENIDGLFSNTSDDPTTVSVNNGNGRVYGSVSGNSDYFTFNIANNLILNSIKLINYISVDNISWMGIQSGSSWTSANDPALMLDQQHFGSANIGQNILSNGSPYFSGDYTMRIQQLGANTSYVLEFNVSLAPTPTNTNTTTPTNSITPTVTPTPLVMYKVPLEDSGGTGTASGHWENNYRDSSYPGSEGFGYPGISNELMVGSISPGQPRILSKLSIGALVDFGYIANNPGSSEGNPTIVNNSIIAQNHIYLNCQSHHIATKVGTIVLSKDMNSSIKVLSTPVLFDKSSWASVVTEPYKAYLDQAADRWASYISYHPDVVVAIKNIITPIDFSTWNGLGLQSSEYSLYTDPSINTIASCGPYNYVDLQPNSAGVQFNSLTFGLDINNHYLNIFSSNDWINILTHELGHALGIGIYWDSFFQNRGAIPPDNYFLDGNSYINTKNAYLNLISSNSVNNYAYSKDKSTTGLTK